MPARPSPADGAPLLLLAALPGEADLLTPRLAPAPALGRRPTWAGRLGGREVVLVLTGLGLVNAAQAAAAALERLPRVAGVLNLGCGGAYPGSGLAVGQVAAASQAILADWGVAGAGGWQGLETIGIPLGEHRGAPLYHRLPADPGLLAAFAARGIGTGAFASLGLVSGHLAAAEALARRWGALLEDMETAAVALTALHYGVPWGALRGVSNQAGQRALDVPAGARAAQRAFLAWAGEEKP